VIPLIQPDSQMEAAKNLIDSMNLDKTEYVLCTLQALRECVVQPAAVVMLIAIKRSC